MVDVDDIPVKDFPGTAALVVTGTGLSESPSREATLFAMECATSLVYRIAAERSDIIWTETPRTKPCAGEPERQRSSCRATVVPSLRPRLTNSEDFISTVQEEL